MVMITGGVLKPTFKVYFNFFQENQKNVYNTKPILFFHFSPIISILSANIPRSGPSLGREGVGRARIEFGDLEAIPERVQSTGSTPRSQRRAPLGRSPFLRLRAGPNPSPKAHKVRVTTSLIFRCLLASLYEVVSVCLSVGRSDGP